jgi:DNA gyrase subunit B
MLDSADSTTNKKTDGAQGMEISNELKNTYSSVVLDGEEGYGASSIEYYQGTEAVRKRPGMYIGDVDSERGVLNMTTEIIDNAIDEHLAGYGNKINIILEANGAVTVEDNGRGIPVEKHKSGVSAFELVLTQLHAGGKFNNSSYKISGGTHGVGAAVVIALSKNAEAHTVRDGLMYSIRFINGKKIEEISKNPTTKKHGTIITFLPDDSIFSIIDINYSTLLARLHEIAYLNNKLTLVLEDKKAGNGTVTIAHPGGIADFWKTIGKNPLHNPIHMQLQDDVSKVQIEMGWQDSTKEEIRGFTNNIYQIAGGTHVTGLRYAVTKVILKHYAISVPKSQQLDITGEDIRCGLTAVLSLYLPEPKFASQTKDLLSSKEGRPLVEKTVNHFLDDWISKNPSEAKRIFMHITRCANMRINFQKKKDVIDNKKNDLSSMTHKFANCQSNNPKEKELMIVEGESAGGSAKTGRNPKFQAVLSIQGKLLNVEKATMLKFLECKEFNILINVLNCGIGEESNMEKISFHKIIIMTDADVDGSHIRTLLLTFFFKYLPELILRGYLYIARPPLYSVSDRNYHQYVSNSQKLKHYIYDNFLSKMKNDDQFNISSYFALLDYKKLIEDSFQDINHLFVSRLLMAGILDVMESSENCHEQINQVQKKFYQQEKSYFNISLKEFNANQDLVIYLEYKSFYTKHTTNISFTRDFYDKMSKIMEKIKVFFLNGMTIKNKGQDYVFDEPLQLLTFVNDTMRNSVHIQRYKGLGEMNPEQLWETSLDPKRRIIEQVFFDEESVEETSKIFQILLGEDVSTRKSYIFQNYDYQEEEEANQNPIMESLLVETI